MSYKMSIVHGSESRTRMLFLFVFSILVNLDETGGGLGGGAPLSKFFPPPPPSILSYLACFNYFITNDILLKMCTGTPYDFYELVYRLAFDVRIRPD